MSSNETATEYRAVGIWSVGGRDSRHVSNWLPTLGEARELAAELRVTLGSAVVEERDVSAVREVEHVG